MPLKLNELIKKAKNKGLATTKPTPKASIHENSKPWQQESLLFTQEKESIKDEEQIKKETVNREQTGNKLGTNWGQNWEQTGSKLGTNREQKNSNREQTGNKLGSELGTQLGTNWEQTGNKPGTKITFSSLVGLQRMIVIFIYNECKIARSKHTENLSIEYISNTMQSAQGSVKTSIKRLTNKGIIERINFKNGRGGWSKYAIPDYLFQEILQYETNNKLGTNWEQTGNKLGSELGSELGTTTPIVSSYIINNKLLTTTALPEEYKNLDLSCLTNIGFDESHIIQIHREYTKKPELTLSADIIQNSINAFAFDLKHNNISNDFKSSPAVVITYLLKKGQPYSSKTPEKVLTPQEEAMQDYLLAQEKKQQKITEIKTKARELALQEWLDSLSEDELLNFNQELRPDGIPDRIYQKSRRKKAEELAKDYFDTVLWPKQLKQILNSQVALNAIEPQT